MTKQTFSPEESWQKATLANRFLFYKIFTHYPDMCKKLLELLLHIEIDRIEPPEGEKSFEIDFDSKGIRLDIYTKTDGQVFDVELQAVDTKRTAPAGPLLSEPDGYRQSPARSHLFRTS